MSKPKMTVVESTLESFLEPGPINYEFVICKTKGNSAYKKKKVMNWNEFVAFMRKSVSREIDSSLSDKEIKKFITICEGWSNMWQMRMDMKKMITLDFDNAKEKDYTTLINYLNSNGIRYFIHNTQSHLLENGSYRFRAYIPMAEPVGGGFYKELIETFLWDVYCEKPKTKKLLSKVADIFGYNQSKPVSDPFDDAFDIDSIVPDEPAPLAPRTSTTEAHSIVDRYCLNPYSFMALPPASGVNALRIFKVKEGDLINPNYYFDMWTDNSDLIKARSEDMLIDYGHMYY